MRIESNMKSLRHLGRGLLVALIVVGFAGPSQAGIGIIADRSDSVTVIDTDSLEVLATIALEPLSDDTCDDGGDVCVNDLDPGTCNILDECHNDTDVNPANECQECDSAQDASDWSDDDTNSCTTCGSGTCECASGICEDL